MPRFTLLPADSFDLDRHDWASNEQRLIDASVQQQGGVALVHYGRDGIVVPRSYRHKPGFAAARAALAADGLPVHIRLSGGGVVPQSPATVNLQLAYPARANRLEAALHSPQRYRPDSTTAIADYAAANAEAVAATLRDLLQNGAATWPET